MFFINLLKRNKKGSSLVEVLIVMLIVVIAFNAFYTVSTSGTKYIIEAKNGLAATALVNEKMEIVRNLEYDDIGTQGAVSPVGNLLKEETVTSNGRSYNVKTEVNFIDDSFDGEFPTDVIQNDYKVVKITVSWTDSNGQNQEVSSISRFVPPGLETTVGGSPLAINVTNSGGTGVPQANVHIVNSALSIDDTIQTNDEGHIMIPSAPASVGGYHFTITKNGYETVATMDSSTTFFPTYPHASVILGSLNPYTFEQNKLSDLIIKSADYQNNPVGSVEFSIGGGKVIGRDDLNNNIFSMAETTDTTGSTSGEKEYADISPGNYVILMNSNTQYEFIDFDPSVSPAVLASDSELTYTIRVADKNVDALFVKINDNDTNAPVADAQVTLTDGGGIDIFTNKTSSQRGIVFYPDSSSPLPPATYTLKVEASGYVTQTKSVNVNNLTQEAISLIKE